MTQSTKKECTDIAILLLCLLILVGAVISIYILCADKTIIKMDIEPGQMRSVCFKNLCLLPGEESKFTLILSSEYAQEYRLRISFSDLDPTLQLKDYAYIRMEKDGEVICDELLAEVFTREGYELAVDFTDGAKNEIKIIYYMPENVGNEAQNAEAKFNLIVTATDE